MELQFTHDLRGTRFEPKYIVNRKGLSDDENKLPIKSATFHLPSREIQTNISRILTAQYAMHVSFLSTANFLVTIFVKSEWELFDKYE